MPIDTNGNSNGVSFGQRLCSAAAIVRFSGLGVLRFNGARTLARNIFVHEAGHSLTVEIFKPLVARLKTYYALNPREAEGLAAFRSFPYGAESRDALYKRVAVYEDIDVSQMDTHNGHLDVCIDISGEGLTAMDRIDTYEPIPAPLDRLAESLDRNDFKWVVNVTEAGLLGNPTTELSTSAPTTELNIQNAMFYTHNLAGPAARPFIYEKVAADMPGMTMAEAPRTTFGMINDEIGAVIEGEQVKVGVAIGTEEHTHVLPKLEMPYVIYIKNNASVSGSDMPIYKELYETTGPTFDLLTDEEIGLQGASTITAREFCSGIFEEYPPGF